MTDALRLIDITEDQLEDVVRIRVRAFGNMASGAYEEWAKGAMEFIRDGRFVGVADGDQVVAAARFWNFRQWWGGRQVPMAGVAGVVVSPEYRGRGVGSMMMRGVLQRSVDKGFPISALYPATTVIYRQLGYEFGGGRYRFSFRAADLRGLGGKDVSVRRAVPGDAARFLELVGKVHESGRAGGPITWPDDKVAEWLGEDESFAYIADDGFVVYRWDDGDNLRVEELVAGSEATARALWATVGSGSSIAETVNAYVSPHDPVHLLASYEAGKNAQIQRWMLRLLDAPAAIAARGFAPAVAVEVDLQVDDPELTANTGRWHLSIANGTGQLVPSEGTSDAVRVGPRGLAALYAGTPVAALRGSGLASGGSTESDTLLDTAFTGPAPYMLDYF